MHEKERRSLATGIALGAALLAGGAARAETPPEPMNRVEFSVTRETQVENDLSSAVLAVTDEDRDAGALADRVNRAMAWALEQARAVQTVRPRSGAYRTFPVADKGRITHWRARQELVLESEDLEALTRLLGALQARLELASLGFSVSEARRRQVEDTLIAEALAGFGQRAEIVRQSLEAARYTIVRLSIQTGGVPFEPVGRGMARATAEAAPPALEAGTSRIQVSVHGTIQLE